MQQNHPREVHLLAHHRPQLRARRRSRTGQKLTVPPKLPEKLTKHDPELASSLSSFSVGIKIRRDPLQESTVSIRIGNVNLQVVESAAAFQVAVADDVPEDDVYGGAVGWGEIICQDPVAAFLTYGGGVESVGGDAEDVVEGLVKDVGTLGEVWVGVADDAEAASVEGGFDAA